MTRDERKRHLKAEALVRQAARIERTPQQQLERLDTLLGVGVGARKERARLQREVQKTSVESPTRSQPRRQRRRKREEK